MEHWKEVQSDVFRYGFGVVSRYENAKAKWNFDGSQVSLFAPKGPDYGTAIINIDGNNLATVDFNSSIPEKTHCVFVSPKLKGDKHAINIRAVSGNIPIDVIEVSY